MRQAEIVQLMTAEEALACIAEIKNHVGGARAKLLDLDEREGWRALGYDTWRDCVAAEFGQTQTHLYRELAAAKLEQKISPLGEIGRIPETHLRPLGALKKEPDQQVAAWERANDTAPASGLTAAHVAETVRVVKEERRVTLPVIQQVASKDGGDRTDMFVSTQQTKSPVSFNRTNEHVDWAWWTWNPVTGCLHDCPYCYARDIANRFYPTKFAPTFHPERLTAPTNTRAPQSDDPRSRRVFTCSMADLFGNWVPQEWIDAVFEQVRDSPQWEFLFLTKFPQRLASIEWPDNAWVGTTVDRQYRVAIAEKAFRGVKAGVKWLSCEPMLEPLKFTSLEMFDWVVIGGQSASSQEPAFQPPWEWIEDLLAQARAAGCRVYFKDNLHNRPQEQPRSVVASRAG